MKTVLIANPKGGAGKTTLTTNLAGYLANQGEDVYLWDLDRQKSSLLWLSLRPDWLPPIQRLDARSKTEGKEGWLVLDTPAGLHGEHLDEALKRAHKVIVPLVPSPYDIEATRHFLDELLNTRRSRRARSISPSSACAWMHAPRQRNGSMIFWNRWICRCSPIFVRP